MKQANGLVQKCEDPQYLGMHELLLSDFGEGKIVGFKSADIVQPSNRQRVHGNQFHYSPEQMHQIRLDEKSRANYRTDHFKNDTYGTGIFAIEFSYPNLNYYALYKKREEKELSEDPTLWNEAHGTMGPNHAMWEDLLEQIFVKYTQHDFYEDTAVIKEYIDIIRSMLTYKMDSRPQIEDILHRMTKLFSAIEQEQGYADSVYNNLRCAMECIRVRAQKDQLVQKQEPQISSNPLYSTTIIPMMEQKKSNQQLASLEDLMQTMEGVRLNQKQSNVIFCFDNFKQKERTCKINYLPPSQFDSLLVPSSQSLLTLKWNTVSLSFPQPSSIPNQRNFRSIQMNDRFFIFGGLNSNNKEIASVWSVSAKDIFSSPASSSPTAFPITFSEHPAMLTPRIAFGLCASTSNSSPPKVYIIGGANNYDGKLRECEEFEISSNATIKLPPLLTASAYHTCFTYDQHNSEFHSQSPTDTHPLLLFKYGGKNKNGKCHSFDDGMVEVLDLSMKKEWKGVNLSFADPSLNNQLLVSTYRPAILATSAKDVFLVYGGENDKQEYQSTPMMLSVSISPKNDVIVSLSKMNQHQKQYQPFSSGGMMSVEVDGNLSAVLYWDNKKMLILNKKMGTIDFAGVGDTEIAGAK